MQLIKISAIFVYFEILKYKSPLIRLQVIIYKIIRSIIYKITSLSDSVFSFKYNLYNL